MLTHERKLIRVSAREHRLATSWLAGMGLATRTAGFDRAGSRHESLVRSGRTLAYRVDRGQYPRCYLDRFSIERLRINVTFV